MWCRRAFYVCGNICPNIDQLDFNSLDQLERSINSQTAAVFIEFIQGEGGVRLATEKFVSKIISLRDKYDFIIVADEVQSGIGRTGKAFAFNHFNIQPDLLIIAKAIGAGLPLGALITSEKYSKVFGYGDHGSTFGGNPVSCAAGLTVLDEVFEKGLVNKVAKLGNYFINELKVIQESNSDKIIEIRGLGFMIGIEMQKECSNMVEELRNKEILVNCTNENVIRVLPPLISTETEIDLFLDVFKDILNN